MGREKSYPSENLDARLVKVKMRAAGWNEHEYPHITAQILEQFPICDLIFQISNHKSEPEMGLTIYLPLTFLS
jgi:hypothetical protein